MAQTLPLVEVSLRHAQDLNAERGQRAILCPVGVEGATGVVDGGTVRLDDQLGLRPVEVELGALYDRRSSLRKPRLKA